MVGNKKNIDLDDSTSIANKRQQWAEKTIKNYAFGSAVTGLIPFPLIDLVILTSIQLKLISRLSDYYGVNFSKEKTKNILISLTGSAVPIGLTGTVGSLIKVVPLIGYPASVLSMPVLASASTYAIGKLFVRHFESGGTFLNFDVNKSKSYYDEQVKKGKELAELMIQKNTIRKGGC